MKKRGRPREFDEDEVSEALMRVFWEKGFNATSLDDLAAASNLNRPSLYAAFGNKLDMFVMCLDRFGRRMAIETRSVLRNADSLDAALNGFFSKLIEVYFSEKDGENGLGCLLFSNAVVEAPSHPEIQAVVSGGMEAIEGDLAYLIKSHIPESPNEKVEQATELLMSSFLSLGVRIRAGADKKSAEKSAADSTKAIITLLEN